ncbi:hypothetical protein ONZ43_g783 [Nemania bipapillata]|uniref:Uncharacterized protein n=1 Tax=Nemania bipapillata TaxID=110536 RepID=A0ACC2J734_9PEZI|nr:hypothetical protein ONZ43_g783 [Nemania bipapillata]
MSDTHGPKLSGGGFGFVVQAKIPAEHQNYVKTLDQGDTLSVAVKILSINDPHVNDDREQYFFQREMKALKAMVLVNKDHLIKFHGAFKREIKKPNGNIAKEYQRGFVFPIRGLADGIRGLHAINARHGDIKPSNILLFPILGDQSKYKLVIADAGMAKIHQHSTSRRPEDTTTKFGSAMYEPPELNGEKVKLSRRYDVWSFGCVVFEILVWLLMQRTGKLREDVTDSEVASSIASRLNLALSADRSQFSICDQCKSINFLSDEIRLNRDLKAIETSSKECSLCKVLHEALLKTTAATGGSFQLFRSKYTWKSASSEPVLTVYSSLDRKDPPVDTSSYAQMGLPQLPRAGSKEKFALLREWIRRCSETHTCILQRQADDSGTRMPIKLPTRLIEVGEADDNSLVRLVVNPPTTADDPTRDQYAALSHCWGDVKKDDYSCLLAANRMEFEECIPVEKLPKMFQDAITATRNLGIRYLWIDSLCIIQDDNGADWAAELRTMEDVYSLAHVTLAASSAPSSLVGFLERPNRAFAVMPYPNPNPHAGDGDGDDDGSRSLLYIAEAIDDFQTHVEDAVLNTRAWVLQERALSRRTIHFTSTQVYWECGEGVHCETLAQLRNTVSHFLGDHHFPDGALSYFKNERILLIQYLYTRYSELSIKYGTDRPAAIHSLETRLGRTFGSLVAGGVFRKFFERTILWQAHFDGSLARVDYSDAKSGQTAPPSWSCLAYSGEIKFLDIPFGDVSWTGDLENPLPTADYEDAATVPNIASLDARARKITIKDFNTLFSVTLDTRETADKRFRKLWRCITVGRDKTPNARGQTANYVLLIRRINKSPPTYERVGAGVLYTSEFSDEVEDVRLV